MRRLGGHLFALVSLLTLFPLVLLWVRSHNGGESLERVDAGRRIVITSGSGLITVCVWDGVFAEAGAPPGWHEPPPGVWHQWKHWRTQTGLLNDGELIAGGGAYPVLLSGGWLGQLGFDATDQVLRPTMGFLNIHDWLQPTWPGRRRTLTVPLYAIVGLFAMPPSVLAFRTARRVTRAKRGLCPACGYDLRASPEQCPECGAEAARANRA